jgi:hypothetical protein
MSTDLRVCESGVKTQRKDLCHIKTPTCASINRCADSTTPIPCQQAAHYLFSSTSEEATYTVCVADEEIVQPSARLDVQR